MTVGRISEHSVKEGAAVHPLLAVATRTDNICESPRRTRTLHSTGSRLDRRQDRDTERDWHPKDRYALNNAGSLPFTRRTCAADAADGSLWQPRLFDLFSNRCFLNHRRCHCPVIWIVEAKDLVECEAIAPAITAPSLRPDDCLGSAE